MNQKRVLLIAIVLLCAVALCTARPPPSTKPSKINSGRLPHKQFRTLPATDREDDGEAPFINAAGTEADGTDESDDEDGHAPLKATAESAHTRFIAAFLRSAAMIVTSEIGDKTFFIAAIMAMKHPRWEVFISAITALLLMTILSAAMGFTLPNLLPPELTHWASIALFLFFGVKLLKNAWEMGPQDKPNEEAQEVEEELEKLEMEEANPEDLESGRAKAATMVQRVRRKLGHYVSPVFIQCFTMTFAAEWGDRSQISTIALAAAYDPIGVTIGGILGHAICTGGAVLSGKWAATRISERAVAWVGGALFLVFALHSIYAGPETTSRPVSA